MNEKIGVLVFPAGEINSVELHDALATCVNIRLFGASSVDRHGEYVFKNYISNVPMISDYDFITEFNRIIDKHSIDVVFPTHDTVVQYLATHSDEVHAKIIGSDKNTAEICRDKQKTFDLFKGESFCPKMYSNITELPVFVKPRFGQGAVGARKIEDIETIDTDEYVICEYLPGKELTVDCLTDRHRKLKSVLPRSRNRIFGGVSVSASSETLTDEIRHIAETINLKLNFLGLWYFQIKQDVNGEYKLLEISTRCAGTMCMSRAKGINLPLLSVYAAMGREIEIAQNPFRVIVDRTLISRYKIDYKYSRVYIDYDDTIIVNDDIHIPAVHFLYQCRNKGIDVILLTRHECDHDDTVEQSLSKHAICASLFSKILKLSSCETKASVIEPENAVFIDNAYAERQAVLDCCGIPVFDVDGIEVLLDWRS
ncbi:MAG: ATP-grasp domain-containing protein [Acidobacteriota bacterium]|jgi:predicted ATP-grasp superfamily ATP-dependent carboligase|nr:ATP-grasp domain-containing protein [Acidobacteriota bacterium]